MGRAGDTARRWLHRGRDAARPHGVLTRAPMAGLTPGYAMASPGRHLGARRFLDDLRTVLSAIDGPHAPVLSDGAARAGFAEGQAPSDFERIAALVELAQKGDAEAFGIIYERYVDQVYRFLYVRVGNAQVAEDLTSETFMRALRRIDSFSWQGRDIAAWFITIARNLIMDNAKSARYRLEVSTADMLDADQRADAAPEAEVLTRVRDARLVDAIKTLKPEQAECLVLRFLQELSLAETAEVLGKSQGAVKQLQLRAVRALRKELEGEEW
ncbi:MAG: sigma-70 family RNA polymerase sigma factor [Nostocoides sp.]